MSILSVYAMLKPFQHNTQYKIGNRGRDKGWFDVTFRQFETVLWCNECKKISLLFRLTHFRSFHLALIVHLPARLVHAPFLCSPSQHTTFPSAFPRFWLLKTKFKLPQITTF